MRVGERGPGGGGGRGPDSGTVRAAPGSHHPATRHRGGRQSACIVRAPRESRRPWGRSTGQGGGGCGGRAKSSACLSSRRDPLRPSLRFRLLLLRSFPPLPAQDPRQECRGGEGRNQGARGARFACGGAGERAPRTALCNPALACRARSPLRLAGWQAGRPPAPSRSLLRARPRLLGRLGQSELGSCPSPPAPPNQHALSSVDPLALRLTPLAPPPLISLLQSPEALGSVPPAFSNPGSAPKLGPWRPPPGRAFVIVGTSAQADPTEAGACSGQ